MPSDSDELLLGGQDRKGTRWLASSRGAGGPRDLPESGPSTHLVLPPPCHPHIHTPRSQAPGSFTKKEKGGSDKVSGR